MKTVEEGVASIMVHSSLVKAYLENFCTDLDKRGWSKDSLIAVTKWIVTRDQMNAQDARTILRALYSIALHKGVYLEEDL